MELSIAGLLVAYVTVAVSGFVHGAVGLGFPLLATPLLTLVTDVRSAIVLTLLPTATLNAVSLFSSPGWQQALARFWPLALATAAGSWAGTRWIIATDPTPYSLLLAGIIFLYLVSDRLRGPTEWRRPRYDHPLLLVLLGLACGWVSGLVNVLAPILILYALELAMPTALMVPVFNLTFMSSKLTQILGFGLAGNLDRAWLLTSLPLTAVATATLWAGMRVRHRCDRPRYVRWLKLVLAVAGLLLIGQFLHRSW